MMNNLNSAETISSSLHFERVKLIFNAHIQLLIADCITYPETGKPGLKELSALLKHIERLEQLKGD